MRTFWRYRSGPVGTAALVGSLFFVATAPSRADGHVNVSPKGYDTFRVLDGGSVWVTKL